MTLLWQRSQFTARVDLAGKSHRPRAHAVTTSSSFRTTLWRSANPSTGYRSLISTRSDRIEIDWSPSQLQTGLRVERLRIDVVPRDYGSPRSRLKHTSNTMTHSAGHYAALACALTFTATYSNITDFGRAMSLLVILHMIAIGRSERVRDRLIDLAVLAAFGTLWVLA